MSDPYPMWLTGEDKPPEYPLWVDIPDEGTVEGRMVGPGNVPGQVCVAVHTEFGMEIRLLVPESYVKPKVKR
jgi:hypothetical protein